MKLFTPDPKQPKSVWGVLRWVWERKLSTGEAAEPRAESPDSQLRPEGTKDLLPPDSRRFLGESWCRLNPTCHLTVSDAHTTGTSREFHPHHAHLLTHTSICPLRILQTAPLEAHSHITVFPSHTHTHTHTHSCTPLQTSVSRGTSWCCTALIQ